jgi:hypothetical protein
MEMDLGRWRSCLLCLEHLEDRLVLSPVLPLPHPGADIDLPAHAAVPTDLLARASGPPAHSTPAAFFPGPSGSAFSREGMPLVISPLEMRVGPLALAEHKGAEESKARDAFDEASSVHFLHAKAGERGLPNPGLVQRSLGEKEASLSVPLLPVPGLALLGPEGRLRSHTAGNILGEAGLAFPLIAWAQTPSGDDAEAAPDVTEAETAVTEGEVPAEVGAPVAGSGPLDWQSFQKGADAFFAQLGQLTRNWSERSLLGLAPWALLAGVVGWELFLQRKARRASERGPLVPLPESVQLIWGEER